MKQQLLTTQDKEHLAHMRAQINDLRKWQQEHMRLDNPQHNNGD